MPNEQYLEEFVSPAGFKQLTDLSKAIDVNNKALQDGIVVAKQYADQIGNSKGIGDFEKKAQQAAKAQEAISAATAKTQLAEEKLAAFRQAQQGKQDAIDAKRKAAEDKEAAAAEAKIIRIKRIDEQEKLREKRESEEFKKGQTRNNAISAQEASYAAAIKKTTVQVATNTAATKGNSKAKAAALLTETQASVAAAANSAAIKRQAIETIAAKGSIDQRTAALARLTATYTALTVAERTSAAGIRLGTQIIPGLTAQVATLNAATTVTAVSTSALSTSFSLLKSAANILPGIGIAGIIAFATGPIIEYISKIDLFKKKIVDLVQARKEVSNANLEGTQNAQAEIVQLVLLYQTAQNVALSSELRYNAAKKLQDQYPKTFANYTVEQIELGKVDDAYTRLTKTIIATAKAKASEQKITENVSRQLANDELISEALLEYDKERLAVRSATSKMKDPNYSTAIQGLADRAVKAEERQALAAKKVTDAKRDSEILDKRNLALVQNIVKQQELGADISDFTPDKGKVGKKEKAIKEAPENFGTTLQDIIKQSELIFKNEEESYEKRFGALDSFIENSLVLAENDEFKKNAICRAGEKERLKIVDQANKQQLELINESEKLRVQELTNSNNDAFEKLEAIREKDTIDLENRYSKGIIDKEQYESELFTIESSYAKDRLAIQIETLAKIVDIQSSDLDIGIGTNEALMKSERELSALRIQLAQLQRKEIKQTAEERTKEAEKELAGIKQLTEKTLEFGKALIDGIYTRRLNALADESAALNKKKSQDIENVNDSVLSEEEKADKIAIINARAQAQQDILDEKIRQQKIKQAKADKAAAIAQIIIQTALAQIKVIGQTGVLGFVFSPLITALGALSLATAIATPIPKFAKGTNNSPEGLAWVGEQGAEGRINPDGSTELTPNKPTLTYLNKGTKIIPHHKLVSMMAKPDQYNFAGAEQVPWGQLIASNDRLGKKLSKAFGDQSINSTQVTKGGWKATQTKMSNLQRHIKRNLS
ncbi:MAG: hypothetical protein V4608_14795 [Bacteroidota bacterium]